MSQGSSAISDRATSAAGTHTGKLLRDLIRSGKSFSGHERNCCFLNTHGPRFANVSAVSGFEAPDDARALGLVDWDRDGDLDIWQVNRSGPQVRFWENRLPTDKQAFLQLRLQGTDSNRDAIGARIRLHTPNFERPPLIRTLQAGDGYLSQSSKWIHFGLGDPQTVISRVEIHWPSGRQESIGNLEINHRYEITEGSGQAIERPVAARRPLPMVPAEASTVAIPDRSRIFITAPTPVPAIHYDSLAGTVMSIGPMITDHQAVLLTIWSTSCVPCLSELKSLCDGRHELQAANIGVLALCVDRLQSTETSEAAPLRILDQIGYPFDSGWATASAMDQLQLIHDSLFDLHRPLTLPCSFLIDRQGRLSAIYRGPVELAQVLADASAIRMSPQERRSVALPLAGKWSADVRQPRLLTLLVDLLAQGAIQETIELMEQNKELIAADPESHVLLFNLGQHFTKSGEHATASRYYQSALERRPDFASAHYNLATTYALAKQFDRAVDHFRRAAESEPQNGETQLQLGRSLCRAGEMSEGIAALERAAQLTPDNGAVHYELALSFAVSGNTERGLQAYRLSLSLDRDTYSNPLHLRQFQEAARIGLASPAARSRSADVIRNLQAELEGLP